MNHSVAVDQNQLRNDKPVNGRDAKKRKHLVAGCPAYRERRLLFFGKIAHQEVGIIVERNIERLEAAGAQLILKAAHDVRCRLAVRAGGENEFERDHFAAILAEKLLAFSRHSKCHFRSFSNSGRKRTRRKRRGRKHEYTDERKQCLLQTLFSKIPV